MIEVEVGDTIVEFPDGTAPAVMQRALSQRFPAPESKPAEPTSALGQAAQPITSYPETYAGMNREAREQMSRGLEQLQKPTGGDLLDSAGSTLSGLGNLAGGALGYGFSPIAAGLRTIAGKPLENTLGIPKEYTEFAGSLALPMPKSLPKMPLAQVEGRAAPTVGALKADYEAARTSPEVAGAAIRPEATKAATGEISADLTKEWLDPKLAPNTYHILQQIHAPSEAMTMQGIDSARRRLGAVIEQGGNDGRAAYMVKKKLDDWMGSMSQEDALAGDVSAAQGRMQEGRGNYAAAKLSEALDAKIAQAEARADRTSSGMNVQNLLYQKAGQFLDSKAARGLTEDQRKMVEDFSRGSPTEKGLRFGGNLLGGGGGLGALASGSFGGAVAGAPGFALPVIGYGLNRLGAALTVRNAHKLTEVIRSESPLARQLQGPLEDFGKAAQEAEVSPTARNLSRLTIASRNLSNNLKDANIKIAPNDILKSLFGQQKAAADDNE